MEKTEKKTAEEWRNVAGYEDMYMVSNIGNVKSIDRTLTRRDKPGGYTYRVKGFKLISFSSPKGYKYVRLSKNDVSKTCLVHRLVAIAFIPNPNNKLCVNHLDGNPSNNHVSNLEWCTHSENMKHSFKFLGNTIWTKGKVGKYHNRSKNYVGKQINK